MKIRITLEVQTTLGARLALVAPVSTAITEMSVFRWTLGKEIVRACQDVVEYAGVMPELRWQVNIRDEAQIVWQASAEQQRLVVPFDASALAEQVYELHCPTEIVQQLAAGHKYPWEFVLTAPYIGADEQVQHQTQRQRAAFRVLDQAEQAMLRQMLAALPAAADDAESSLLRGAIHEAFGLYEVAIQAYETASADQAARPQAYARLAAVYERRAYELLALADKQPRATPIACFASQANQYSALAAAQETDL